MIELRLPYQAPYDWARTLRFLVARSTKGVELVRDDAYLRTVQLGDLIGWFRARNAPDADAIVVDYSTSLVEATDTLLSKLRHLFDLDARPDIVTAHFANDALLGDAIRRRPGLRVPGAFDGFELATRAILGQQITVKAATTIAGRFAAAFDATISQLVALPGIGPWTAHYIAMRALRWPDAFPPGDIALRNALGSVNAARAEELSLPWRPWRSYATLHLWAESGEQDRVTSN